MESLVNPVSNVRKPKLPPGRDRRLAGDEEQRLLEHAEYPMHELIVLALETGMRQGELMALTWQGVDLKRRIVTLDETKAGNGRAVPLSKRAVKTIESLPRRLDGRLFPDAGASSVAHKFRALCNAAGIEGLRFHDLRHEATSRLLGAATLDRLRHGDAGDAEALHAPESGRPGAETRVTAWGCEWPLPQFSDLWPRHAVRSGRFGVTTTYPQVLGADWQRVSLRTNTWASRSPLYPPEQH